LRRSCGIILLAQGDIAVAYLLIRVRCTIK